MPLRKGLSEAIIGNNIKEMQASGYPHNQAVAAALNTAHPNARKRVNAGRIKPARKLTAKTTGLGSFMRQQGIGR